MHYLLIELEVDSEATVEIEQLKRREYHIQPPSDLLPVVTQIWYIERLDLPVHHHHCFTNQFISHYKLHQLKKYCGYQRVATAEDPRKLYEPLLPLGMAPFYVISSLGNYRMSENVAWSSWTTRNSQYRKWSVREKKKSRQ